MDTAFVVAIVAVVLGGIGLIGGVLGYAQGAAALHRAASARQRATAAEEAALQARFAAEATARSAEELLARLQPGAGADSRTGPVATTGPVGLAPASTGPVPVSRPSAPLSAEAQRFTTGPIPSSMPEPTTGALLLPGALEPQEQQPGDAVEFPLARALQARLAEGGDRPAPSSAAVPPPAAPASGPWERLDRADGPVEVAETAALDPIDAGRPEEGQPAEAFVFPVSPEPPSVGDAPRPTGVVSVQTSQIVTVRQQGPTAGPGEEEPDAPVEEPDAQPVGVSIEALAAAFEAEAARGAEPQPDEEAQPERGSRGQVVARAQDQPPMDWAEVLRTGAIPLPSISRGTYSAPRRSPNPTREGPARFELRVTGRQRYAAVNVGGLEAAEARVEGAGDDPHLVRPLSARPAPVAPGDSLAFSVLRVEGRGAAVQVRWVVDGVEQVQPLSLG